MIYVYNMYMMFMICKYVLSVYSLQRPIDQTRLDCRDCRVESVESQGHSVWLCFLEVHSPTDSGKDHADHADHAMEEISLFVQKANGKMLKAASIIYQCSEQ